MNPPPPSPTISRSQSTWRRSLSQLTLRRSVPAMVVCRVVLLVQENYQVELPKTATGQDLYDNVKQKLSLEEADYFGLSYRNLQNLRFWLTLDKRIDKQLESNKDMVFYWEVKFYPPAPELLNEDLTRYFVVLQIRQDLFTGKLPASFQTQAVLGSFTAQGEIGDFDKRQHTSIDYLRPYSFAPKQSEELLMRIWELHKTCKGLTPAEADLYFLETAKKCALYGVDMYTVKDSANKEVKVGVSACGLYIYHGRLRMECFKWPRVIKMEYKRKVFRVKVRPAEFERNQQTLGYQLPSVKMAKRLMRIAVENHQFFRLKQPELTDTGTLRGFGSRRWRMSGRTQAQLRNMNPAYKSFSRTNSVMSSDHSYPLHQSTGTMPVPASRRLLREPDLNKNYNTIGGRVNGADKMADMSFEVEGEYVLDGPREDSTRRKSSNPQAKQRIPAGGSSLFSPDNLVNGEKECKRDTVALPDHSGTCDKGPGRVHRLPIPSQRSTGELGDSQPLVADNVVATTASPGQLTSMDIQPSSGELQNGARYRPFPLARHTDSNQSPAAALSPSSGLNSPTADSKSPTLFETPALSKSPSALSKSPAALSKSPAPLSGTPAALSSESPAPFPESPAPLSESPTPSPKSPAPLSKTPTPPSGSSTPPFKSPNTDLNSPESPFKAQSAASNSPSTRSKTLNPASAPAMGRFGLGQLPLPSFSLESAGVMPTGGIDHSVKLETAERAEKVIKVGVYTTERDGYTETRVKHTITLSGEADIDDKLLLDAIQAVTGFDNTLGVDKIEIKTETASP